MNAAEVSAMAMASGAACVSVLPYGEWSAFDFGLYIPTHGTTHWIRNNDDGTVTWVMSQDVEKILDRNHELATSSDGWSPTKDIRAVASIPAVLVQDWAHKGIDINDPNDDKKVNSLLNSREFWRVRTAPGNV